MSIRRDSSSRPDNDGTATDVASREGHASERTGMGRVAGLQAPSTSSDIRKKDVHFHSTSHPFFVPLDSYHAQSLNC